MKRNAIGKRTALTLLMLTAGIGVAGCRHGVEISGQGRVTSASGTRDCTAGGSPCRFKVQGRYQETFTAIPANGWLHDAWERCQTPSGRECSFDIPAETVLEFDDADIPGALARFRLPMEPLFRDSNGNFELPDGSATNQLRWLLDELNGSSTTAAEIAAHFDPDFLAQVPTATLQTNIQAMRDAVSNPVVDDLVTATPIFTRGLIASASGSGPGFFLSLNTRYGDGASDGLITGLNYTLGFPRNGSNVGAAEAGKTLQQLGTSFKTVAANTSMLVARIDNDKCKNLYASEATLPRPTGSIFKLWVLGALAEEIKTGRISASAMLPLSADQIVPAGASINDVPLGTQIPIVQMANLMMGNSDNTATDHVFELVGRDRVERTLGRFQHKNKEGMTPFLSTNEQFHVLWSLSPAQASSYANGDDEQQRDILENSIEPLGPVTSFPQYNQDALFESSWSASAKDVCQAYAGLRRYNNRSEAFAVLDQAVGAEAVLLSVRKRWDRVWSKGGSLANSDGNYVLTLSWLFESDDKGAFVVVLMASNPDGSAVNSGPMFSIAARAEEIVFNR